MQRVRRLTMTLPHFAAGRIVKGFQRGTDIGFPTANFEIDVVKNLPRDFNTGIYCGWAAVDDGKVHKMVMSVGWNPFYHNREKSMETHILHTFSEPNLYDKILKVCITHFLRPEADFTTVENLVEAINGDIQKAHQLLEDNAALELKEHSFFSAQISDES